MKPIAQFALPVSVQTVTAVKRWARRHVLSGGGTPGVRKPHVAKGV